MRIPIAFMAVCAIAGCGGGGGGGGDPATPPPPAGATLGTRAMPGYEIQVSSSAPVLAGASLTVQAVVTPDPGLAPPTQVEAAIGVLEPTAWTAGSPAASGWSWTVTLPADLTGQRVWVRLTDPDGNTAESGSEDFALVP